MLFVKGEAERLIQQRVEPFGVFQTGRRTHAGANDLDAQMILFIDHDGRAFVFREEHAARQRPIFQLAGNEMAFHHCAALHVIHFMKIVPGKLQGTGGF